MTLPITSCKAEKNIFETINNKRQNLINHGKEKKENCYKIVGI
jgi:hypothetical protein